MSDDEDPSSGSGSDDEPVEAAVLSRGRRATAGRRLTTLTGQAADDDNAFWGHDTWGEDDDGSFRESDEDADQRVDTFDSDFDDDEIEEADAEKQNAAVAEAEIAREEKEGRQKKRGFAEPAVKKRPTQRRIVGEGLNAGIVLNAPGVFPFRTAAVGRPAGGKLSSTLTPNFATVAATRKPRRSTAQSRYSSRFRSAKQTVEGSVEISQASQQQAIQSAPQLGQPPPSNKRKLTAAERAGDKKKPKRFTQEELLLEAIHQTEPGNLRWILERQRNQTEKDEAHQQAMDRKNQNSGKLVERYTSRRGALNLVHFPSMDHVPDILKGQKPAKARSETIKCVITGRPARYRDPRTGLPYYDSAAFKEIRRRNSTKKAAPTPAPPSDPNVASNTSQSEETKPTSSQQNPATSEKAPIPKKPEPKKKKTAPKKIDEPKSEDAAKHADDSKETADPKKPDEPKSATDSKKKAAKKNTAEMIKSTDAKKPAAAKKRKAAAPKQEKGSKAAKMTPVATPSPSSNQNGAHQPIAVAAAADPKNMATNGKASSSSSAPPSTVSIESSNQPSNTQQPQHDTSAPPPPSLSNPTALTPAADPAASKPTSNPPSKEAATAAVKNAKPSDSPGRRASPRKKRPSAKVLDGAPNVPP